jgi:hypothetical protein
MNASELYQAWAPEGAPWSPWAKPVLFAVASPVPGKAHEDWQAARALAGARWTPPEPGGMALVLDLPGPFALALALGSARRGWRPVPLFNSCPGTDALVDNEPIRAGLVDGARWLGETTLPEAAAPAFVLDSRRTDGAVAPRRFDNRWVVFPQDFPSAARLLSGGIRRVLLVQEGRREPRSDLAHVLLRWQRAGLEILALDLAGSAPAAPIAVPKPSRFRALGYRALVALGLRKSSAGGFGGIVPMPSSGGGGAMWA